MEDIRKEYIQEFYDNLDKVKQIMDDYPSPDELDSVSYAFSEIQSVIQL